MKTSERMDAAGNPEVTHRFGNARFCVYTSEGKLWVHLTCADDDENQLDMLLDDIMQFARDQA